MRQKMIQKMSNNDLKRAKLFQVGIFRNRNIVKRRFILKGNISF
jgi:hypothetical protein